MHFGLFIAAIPRLQQRQGIEGIPLSPTHQKNPVTSAHTNVFILNQACPLPKPAVPAFRRGSRDTITPLSASTTQAILPSFEPTQIDTGGSLPSHFTQSVNNGMPCYRAILDSEECPIFTPLSEWRLSGKMGKFLDSAPHNGDKERC